MESVVAYAATLCHDYGKLFADLGLAIFGFRLLYWAQIGWPNSAGSDSGDQIIGV